jgi:hypothetical protein
MKLASVGILAALLGGCCAPATGVAPCYPDGYTPSASVVDVDGYSYVDHGVFYGSAPADTVIPQDDPPVGRLPQTHESTPQQRILTSADSL